MKYQVGDKVVINKNNSGASSWNSFGKMDKWQGEIMTIVEIRGSDYKMKEDQLENCNFGWYWSDDMIDHKATEKLNKNKKQPNKEENKMANQLYKVGDKVVIKNDVTKSTGVSTAMTHWSGMTMTIKKLDGSGYRMFEDGYERDGCGWFWTDEMIDHDKTAKLKGTHIVAPINAKLSDIEQIIFNKPATIIKLNNKKIVVKTMPSDSFDPINGFLHAWFLATSGMTRTQGNKYLEELATRYTMEQAMKNLAKSKKEAKKAGEPKCEGTI